MFTAFKSNILIYLSATVLMMIGYTNAQQISPNSTGNNKIPIVYGTLSEHLDGSFYVTQLGKLRFRYRERYSGILDLDFTINDMQHNSVPTSGTVSYTKRYGMNWVELDVSGLGLNSKEFYILEARNPKGDVLYQRFLYE